MKMKRQRRDEWVTALLSGEYEQGHSYLRQFNPNTREESYCCLGVLCNLINPDNWYLDKNNTYYYWDGNNSFYPRSDEFDRTMAEKLVEMNDGVKEGDTSDQYGNPYHKYTFDEIAQWIMENVEVED